MASAPTPAPSAGGMPDKTAGILAYITIIPAIVFLVIEPYNKSKYVRFHAFQCLAIAVASIAANVLFIIPILGWICGAVLGLALFVGWIICIVKAAAGEKFKLPILGDFAEKLADSV